MAVKNFLYALTLLFWPQCRADRMRYVREVVGLLLILALGWQCLLSAVAHLSPDEAAIAWTAVYGVPFLINLATIFLGVATIRRLHDMGLSGAWAFLVFVPGFNVLLILFCLLCPGSQKATGWDSADGLC